MIRQGFEPGGANVRGLAATHYCAAKYAPPLRQSALERPQGLSVVVAGDTNADASPRPIHPAPRRYTAVGAGEGASGNTRFVGLAWHGHPSAPSSQANGKSGVPQGPKHVAFCTAATFSAFARSCCEWACSHFVWLSTPWRESTDQSLDQFDVGRGWQCGFGRNTSTGHRTSALSDPFE